MVRTSQLITDVTTVMKIKGKMVKGVHAWSYFVVGGTDVWEMCS